jgi:hypothetical protein
MLNIYMPVWFFREFSPFFVDYKNLTERILKADKTLNPQGPSFSNKLLVRRSLLLLTP